MSYWAELDDNNIVLRVLVGNDNDPNNDKGYQWLVDNLGGTWIETSDENKFRYNFAGIGYTYDSIDDAFIAPTPCNHAELTLNNLKRWECETCEGIQLQRLASQ
jgi:hypothetical protein